MGSVEILTRRGKRIPLSETSLQGFARQLRGTVLTQGDARYDQARRVWNGMIDKKPALIVQCRGTADVMASVDFAREHDLLLSIRAGGHNVSGSAIVEGGFVIDVSEMRSVHVMPGQRLARVESGARLGDLDHETAPFNLAAPVGVVSETGVAGLTLHGGAGWLMRKHGLSIDNLTAVEIVTADGRLLRATHDEHPDLFWALRGGGGKFGVVTAFEFHLHPVGPQVWMSVPIYPLERAGEVIAACRDYMAEAPEDLMVIGVFWDSPVPQYRGRPVVILLGCYTGPLEKAEEVLAPLRAIGRPLADQSGPMKWTEAQQFLDRDYPDGIFYYWKSIYLNSLDHEVIGILAEHTARRPSPESSIDVWFLGGAVTRVPVSDTAFAQRQPPYMIGIEANWRDPETSQANIAWARNVHRDLQQFSDGGSYLNFPGFVEDKEAMLRGAYGPNLHRLEKVKAMYDPDNLFPGLLSITAKG